VEVPGTEAVERPLDKAEVAAMRRSCEQAEAGCDPVALLSRLERRAVDRAMTSRGLRFDRAPAGKRIGTIHVVDLDVFGPGDGFLRWFNIFHITTKASTVKRELLFANGDGWDQHLVDESARHLRDPVSTSLVAIVPVVAGTGTEGMVDVLVVTRDVWSLRANSNYEIQGSQLTYLALSLSENNLGGRRKLLAASFRMDQATYSIGPVYIDKNILGRHVDLRGRAGPVFNRYSSELEGSDSVLNLSRPIWSLDTRWGGSLEWNHRLAIDRTFRGTGLRTYDAPETDGDDMLPYEYHMRRFGLAATVVRGFGERFEHRLKSGYQLHVQRPELLDEFPGTGVARESFIDNVLPRSERTSVVFAGWQVFEARYRNFQNVASFELAEDTRMGLDADASIGAGLAVIGSESNFLRLSGSAGYTGPLGQDGMWRVSVAGTTRVEGGEAIDNIVEGTVRAVSPTVGPGRLVTQVTVAGLYFDSQNQFYTLGGENGLRGYPVGELQGDRRFLWQTELRSRPVPILFTRWGLVLFDDVGSAAASFRSMAVLHDAGFGIRALVPQLDPQVFRFDLAVALDPQRRGTLRFTAGYEQSF
jgi:hypothetical protein